MLSIVSHSAAIIYFISYKMSHRARKTQVVVIAPTAQHFNYARAATTMGYNKYINMYTAYTVDIHR